ncbi:MAG: cobalamin-dependent protein [Deltaproteobacteria bacterium]|nr:cobalamin-dependent protein [Deltaproteobacteria bacterium]
MSDSGPDLFRTAQRLYERALLDRSTHEAANAINAVLQSGAHPLEIYERVIVPGQESVGTRWADGEISISEEHLSTQISIEQMNRLRAVMKPKPPLGKRCTVGSLSGDQHWLGARMVADYFVHDGWNVDFLGASPPLDDLITYLEKAKPDALIFSVTFESDIEMLKQVIARTSKMETPPKIIAGGRGFRTSPSSSKISGAAIASSPTQAVELARKLCGVHGSATELEQILATIGGNIRARRKELKLSQRELADSSDLDRAYISAVEGGKQNVSIGVLLKLGTSLGLTLEQMLRPSGDGA